eukprot:Tamp_16804.p1 GENE.Tamp_16804~~Tamp_16804.p1  ORF type:complete len:408 (-),score=90.36 Tamp_16804:212-1372(-)
MGAYLSQPNTEKHSEDGEGPGSLRYGVSEMQGWRMHMEDAHITKPELSKGCGVGMFAVFDGHGGQEVAKFASKHMPAEFEKIVAEKKGDLEAALPLAFHHIDKMLREEGHAAEIRSLSRNSGTDTSSAAGGAAGGAGGRNNAAMVRSSIDESLEEARKKGKLTQKEAMELMVKMMALQRLDQKAAAGSSADKGGRPSDSSGEERTAAGCTANVVLVTAKHVIVANAGDSRSVMCRKGKALALSQDHKPNNPSERARITKAGGFVTEAQNGHFRVNGNLNLSRSIGDLKYKTNTSLPAAQQVITAEPDVMKVALTPDDDFLVCACDGVWDVMSNQEIVEFVRMRMKTEKKLSKICEDILNHCLADDPKQTQGIGGDNMTCVIVQLKR